MIYKSIHKTIKNVSNFLNGGTTMKTRQECMKTFGSDYFIQKNINDGNLFKICKGIYANKPDVPEEAVYLYKYPNAILTMNSAFYIHGLTDVIPDLCCLATKRTSTRMREENIKQYFIPDDSFGVGAEIIKYKGYDIRIYNKERMLIELIRYKTKLPFDYYKEIILNYRKILPELDIQKIQDYVFMCPKSNKVLEILQAEVF